MALIGTDGPAVVLDARTCAWLERNAGMRSLRVGVRGVDPHISTQLEEIKRAAATWRSSAPTGTAGDTTAEPAEDLEQWLTTGEAAELAGVTSRAIRKAVAEGRLTASKAGSHNRINREDLGHYRAAKKQREEQQR